jgi:hypothetical protein
MIWILTNWETHEWRLTDDDGGTEGCKGLQSFHLPEETTLFYGGLSGVTGSE